MITLQPSVTVSDSIGCCDTTHFAPPANAKAINRTAVVKEWSEEAPSDLTEALSRDARTPASTMLGNTPSNPAASAEFYRDLLGMQIVGGSSADHSIGATAFLSSRPDEESHEIALFANRAFVHLAFKASSLASLRAFHTRVVERNIPIKFAANYGVAFAFYFDDPDGNIFEVYWPTRHLTATKPEVEPKQTQMKPLGLSQPDEVLLRDMTPRQVRASVAPNGTATVVERIQPKHAPGDYVYLAAGAWLRNKTAWPGVREMRPLPAH